jgi:hypothetical protein
MDVLQFLLRLAKRLHVGNEQELISCSEWRLLDNCEVVNVPKQLMSVGDSPIRVFGIRFVNANSVLPQIPYGISAVANKCHKTAWLFPLKATLHFVNIDEIFKRNKRDFSYANSCHSLEWPMAENGYYKYDWTQKTPYQGQ